MTDRASERVEKMEGIININKPQGVTSHDVVQQVREITGVRKVGHCGTLDPSATGVLPMCLGWTTKIAPFLMAATKSYVATMVFGTKTDTQDATGRVTYSVQDVEVSEAALREALGRFTGEIEQVPPMYSALRYRGKRLYELARQGVEVERKPRKVTIYSLDLLEFNGWRATIKAECSGGTYIRTLCHDIGDHLGCGSHLAELERVAVGVMEIEEAITVDQLRDRVERGDWRSCLLSAGEALGFLPSIEVTSECVAKIKNGIPIRRGDLEKLSSDIDRGSLVRVNGPDGRLEALAQAIYASHDLELVGAEEVAFPLRRVVAC